MGATFPINEDGDMEDDGDAGEVNCSVTANKSWYTRYQQLRRFSFFPCTFLSPSLSSFPSPPCPALTSKFLLSSPELSDSQRTAIGKGIEKGDAELNPPILVAAFASVPHVTRCY